MIGTLLFAQLALAAHACPKMMPALDPAARMVVAGLEASKPATGTAAADTIAPSCDDMAADSESMSGNVCAAHCHYGQQSDQASTITVPTAILTALYGISPVPQTPPPHPAATTLSALVAASPPHAILHCVYRI